MKIVKNTLFVLLLIMFFVSSQAQELSLGLKGGLNLANISGGGASKDNTVRPGVHLGGYGIIYLDKSIDLIVELLFSQKGTITKGQEPYWYVRINYLDVPVLVSYNFTEYLSGQAGFSFTTPVSTSRRLGKDGITEDFLPHLNKMVLSLPVGVTYGLHSGPVIGLRFDLGISPIGGDQARNNVLMLSLGYTFE